MTNSRFAVITAFISTILIVMILLSATLGLVVSNETQMKELMNKSGETTAGSTLAETSGLFFAVMPDETAAPQKNHRSEKTDKLIFLFAAFCGVKLICDYALKTTNKIFIKPTLQDTLVLIE